MLNSSGPLHPQSIDTRSRAIVEYDESGLAKGYGCYSCGAKVVLDYVADDRTPWFKCVECGARNWRLRSEKFLLLETHLKDLHRETTLEELDKILDSTVKYDSPNKKITFLMTLLNYTEEDQANIAFNAERSTGKSYIPLEIVWYFPLEDVLETAYSSPTSFFHDYGTWMKEEKQKLINLHQKILVFVDQPHDQLLQRLRPLLSHDRKELTLKITDRRQKSGLRTKTILLIGYPTVLFCSAKHTMHQQERTRLLLLSPETTQEKIRAAILLRIEKELNRRKFREAMEKNPQRIWLRERVQSIKTHQIKNIIINTDDKEQIKAKFFKLHKHLAPRHQRDISRLIGLIKAHALLNCFTRAKDEGDAIIATERDVDAGFQLYREVSEANELGLPPAIYDIYQNISSRIEKDAITRREFTQLYFQVYHRPIGSRRLNEILRILDSCGLIQEEPDPNDRRRKLIVFQKINAPEGGGIHETATPQVVGHLISLKNLVSVHWSNSLSSVKECGVCGVSRLTSWQAETTKGETIPLCESCFQAYEKNRQS